MLKTLRETGSSVLTTASGKYSVDMESHVSSITSLEAALKAQVVCSMTSPTISRSSKAFAGKASSLVTTNSSFYGAGLKDNVTNGDNKLLSSHHGGSGRGQQAAADLQGNLFQAGFEDCASEVIRFLMQQEKMNDNDPLIQGLQSHLHRMGNTICTENIASLDNNRQEKLPSSSLSLLSNINSTSGPLNGLVKSDSAELSLLPPAISSSTNPTDNSPFPQYSIQKRKHSTAFPSCHELPSPSTICSTQAVCSSSVTKRSCQRPYPSHTVNKNCESPFTTLPSSSNRVYTDIPFPCDLSLASGLQLSQQFPLLCPFGLSPSLPLPSYSLCQSSLSTLSSSSSSPSPSPYLSSSFTSKGSLMSEKLPSKLSSSSSSTPLDSDSHNSVLELKANFLPGIDSSSMASGNFADILLAVESCQSHDNPRVRELADKILNLIHNDDDSDDENDDDDDEESENANVVSGADIGDSEGHEHHRSSEFEDSGVDLDEGGVVDWCNPADMIEL